MLLPTAGPVHPAKPRDDPGTTPGRLPITPPGPLPDAMEGQLKVYK